MSQNPNPESLTRVYYEVPPTRHPPRAQSGLWAWVRDNLLGSPLDVVLTLIGLVVIVGVIVSFVQWSVSGANWWAITFNWPQFFKGRYEVVHEWRLAVTTLVAAFIVGMAVAVWVRRIARLGLIVFLLGLVVFFVLPVVLNALFDKPASLAAAGNLSIVSGTLTEEARPQVAFLGRANERVEVGFVPIEDIRALSALSGFMDPTVNVLRNIASTRLQNLARQAEIEATLARQAAGPVPVITANQQARLETELGRLNIPDEPMEAYRINQISVRLAILDAALQPISPPVTLHPQEGRLASFELPADGWYVLQKEVAEGEGEGMAILSVDGLYPIMRSSALEERPAVGQQATTGFVDVFIRMTDNYRLYQPLPRVSGRELPFYVINENQYRGARPVETYLRLYLSTFLEKVGGHIMLVYALGIAGYGLVEVLRRVGRAKLAQNLTVGLLLALVPFVWIMVSGFIVAEIVQALLLLAALAFLAFSYAVGVRLGRSPAALGLWLVGSVIHTVLPYALYNPHYGFGLLALLNLGIGPLALALLFSGAESYGIDDQAKLTRNLALSGGLVLALTLIPVLLLLSGFDPRVVDPNWLLAHSDQRRWGGLLLTMVLTLYGIIASFPLGVALALGRRSSLPAIQLGCTLYIELVRGSPFITVLFMMQLMIPLISPALAEIPNSTRALVATILFSAAYLAENVRGGLQAIPKGQEEAARALGMSQWQIIRLITLPQALRIVIPVLVGQFISLFKDTSLVAIVGLIDLTGYVNTMVVQPEFNGTRPEGLFFITAIYFVFSYVMSYVSNLLEASGAGAARRLT